MSHDFRKKRDVLLRRHAKINTTLPVEAYWVEMLLDQLEKPATAEWWSNYHRYGQGVLPADFNEAAWQEACDAA